MAGAVFSDVEGTLMSGSTPRTFIQTGRRMGVFSRQQILLLGAVALLTKPLPAKLRNALTFTAWVRLIKGYSVAEMSRVLDETMPVLRQNLKPASLARLRQHQVEGMPLVLVSGGWHEVIERLGFELGARGEGTRFEVRDGRYTGRRGGPVCQGVEKARRVQMVAAELGVDLAASLGYGDTLPDTHFLNLLGKAAAIDPDPQMRVYAEQHGWEILTNDALNTNQKEAVAS